MIGRGRERIAAWPAGIASARRRLLQWPWTLRRIAARLAQLLRTWAFAELAPGRLAPWLPVAFGIGIVVYFAAEREPALWAAVPLAAGCAAAGYLARHRPIAFPLLLGIAALTAGFAIATLRTAWISHPVLRYPAWNVPISGWVVARDERERSDRIIVRVAHIDDPRIRPKPKQVRLAVRKGTAPTVGSFVQLKARLTPPLAPLRPGGYDFARDLYFQQLGASGFVLGHIHKLPPPAAEGWGLRIAAALSGWRDAIDARIHSAISGNEASIASALITGRRGAISASVYNAMYISGLGHVLAISGYHMAIVAGVVFFIVRALLALVPMLANAAPIKKWAALGALAAACAYLLLSGASVATQRSFIMIALVLIAVMLDRQALTLRTITIAALMVLVATPEMLVRPSFQMSFAATLALIAVYQFGLGWRADGDTSLGARAALWGGSEIVALLIGSAAAGFATLPYAAYHFHRLAPYGVLANLLAMPVVSAWIMPAGLLAVLAIPFGFDAPLWRLMGHGIDWMTAVAIWVAHLPGAVGRMAAFGVGPLLLGTAGLLILCLLRTPLRLAGVALAMLAAFWAIETRQPDIFVAADGRAIAMRGADGQLMIARHKSDTFAVRDWLAADADPRAITDPSLAKDIRCDQIGCIGHLADGRLVALSLTLGALAEDCRRVAVLASPHNAPPDCHALAIDRTRWRRSGAVELYRDGKHFILRPTRPPGYGRPWAPGYPQHASIAKTRTPNATPRSQDLEPGD